MSCNPEMSKAIPEANQNQMPGVTVPSKETFIHRSHYPCTARELYDYHARPGALERLLPPWEKTRILSKEGGIDPGGKVRLKIQLGPLRLNWEAHHVENEPGRMFRDLQFRGPFKEFIHTHTFSDTERGALLEDRIDFILPAHDRLPALLPRQVKHMLERAFRFREKVIRDDIILHQRCSTRPLCILISGSSGVLGRNLVPLLTTGGHEVWRLVRRKPAPGKREIFWDPERGEIDAASLPQLDAVIHLAGEYIGLSRWSKEKKERVMASRVQGTGLLARTVGALPKKPSVFLSASAVGYYGDRGDATLVESDDPGNDYLSEVCKGWEEAARPATDNNIRTVLMRLGVGLTLRGGALQRLHDASRLGFIRYFGTGEQYISWMSIDDMVAAILHCLVTPELSGPLNIAAPEPVTNRELIRRISKVAGRPRLPPVPGNLLKMIYGQMASEILLSSCRVSVDKLLGSGFDFRHPELGPALSFMLGKEHPMENTV